MRATEKRTVRTVWYYARGLVLADSWSCEVEPDTEPQDVPWPHNAYAFAMSEREDVIVDGETCVGTARWIGGMYYHPDSVVTTPEQVERLETPGRVSDTLLTNMRINQWPAVVWSRWGDWPQPFRDGDVVLEATEVEPA